MDDGYRYGYISNNGDKILEAEYNQVERILEIDASDDIYLKASKNGQVGVYKNKKMLIKHAYETIEYDKDNELFIVQKNNKQGILNKVGNEILSLEYDEISIMSDNIKAEKDGITYNFDKNGNEKKGEIQNIIQTENNNFFIIMNTKNQLGIQNKEGNIVLSDEYSYIEYAYDNYFIITKEGKSSVYDAYKRQEIISEYNVIQRINKKRAMQAIRALEENNYIVEIFNENIEQTAVMENATLSEYNNYIKLLSKTERKYFDDKGNEIENTKAFPGMPIFAFKQEDGKWGFKDIFGTIKIDAIYDMVTEVNSYGFAGIKKDGKWGVINSRGTIVVEPTYELEWSEPDFIGPYCKMNSGYGIFYYTKDL